MTKGHFDSRCVSRPSEESGALVWARCQVRHASKETWGKVGVGPEAANHRATVTPSGNPTNSPPPPSPMALGSLNSGCSM
ncbi:predicted protein [Plenodomus lingam JN3]|uniref:Predicted protein n=1 Tax=Leptosphaeria maculans (strain JN3 / isolate v23.1.3 / race Av1-4-5-6-7-8) TaxID=985895 RepID=E4ZXN4_LEPMJ|nr:predicted protein [Plenodomus lingam JN3]CBX96129.1 predicted protein [Plenodomus lingam JN3]